MLHFPGMPQDILGCPLFIYYYLAQRVTLCYSDHHFWFDKTLCMKQNRGVFLGQTLYFSLLPVKNSSKRSSHSRIAILNIENLSLPLFCFIESLNQNRNDEHCTCTKAGTEKYYLLNRPEMRKNTSMDDKKLRFPNCWWK